MSIERYIESLDIAGENYPFSSLRSQRKAFAVTRSIRSVETVPQSSNVAAVDVGSLLSFVGGISVQDRDDVLFSVQLAQRGASGAYDRFTQAEAWYGKYVEILETVGWTAEQVAFAKYEQSDGEVRMDKAALAIIMAVATQNQLTVLREAVKAMEALAEDDDTLKLFDFHTTARMNGNFQLGAVEKAQNDALAMVLGAFHFKVNDARRNVLFFSWGAQEVDFWTAAQKMTLNTTFYVQHRDSVQRKLGAKVDDFIDALVLG